MLTNHRCGTVHASATFAEQDGSPGTMEVDMNIDCTQESSIMTMPPGASGTPTVAITSMSLQDASGASTWTSTANSPPAGTGGLSSPPWPLAQNNTIHRVEVGIESQFLFNPSQIRRYRAIRVPSIQPHSHGSESGVSLCSSKWWLRLWLYQLQVNRQRPERSCHNRQR